MRTPLIVHKTTYNGFGDTERAPSFDEAPPFNDEQIDIVAGAMAGLRHEFQDMLAAEITKLKSAIAELRDLGDMRAELAELRGAVLNKTADNKSVELTATEVTHQVRRRVRTGKVQCR
jgi:hypothetical protein